MAEKLKIIFVSHTYMGGTYVVGSHHLASQLRKMGHDVLHISTPVTPFHWLNKKTRKENQDRFQLWRKWKSFNRDEVKNIVPLSLFPWKISNKIYRKFKINLTTEMICFPSLKTITDYYEFRDADVVFIDQPNFVGIEKKLEGKVKIYRATDLYSQMSEDDSITIAESQVLSRMHGLIGTSMPVLEHLQSLSLNLPGLLMENGVEYSHFNVQSEEPEDMKAIPHPRAIYIGAMDKRLDVDSLIRLASAKPDLSIILIGRDHLNFAERVSNIKNIYFLGQRSYQHIPYYLNACEIGLLPLSSHESNHGRSPMKLYEYGAAGLAVVSKKSAEIERRKEEFIFLYDNDTEFIRKISEALVYQKKHRKIIKTMVSKHSWEYKTEELMQFVEQISYG
ncbi:MULTISPECIES: glycosyltransferase [unclassified Paenibacillus]|uniref:glycosyltransferase n=1 Tax=unclassified Paenibacillus TaxID=185978 RepID=UPI0016423F88|nr:glycosyltransferase [Paenibacillus sp. Y412MC10]